MISDEQKHPFGDKKESVEESSSERKFNFLQLLLPNAVFPFGALLKKNLGCKLQNQKFPPRFYATY